MLGQPTGLLKDIQCACQVIVTQYHVRAGRNTFWVTREHKAPCGRPCALSPGSLVGDCHIPGKCELCPTQRKQRRGPRVRVKAEVTASPILGQLTANEVRVLNYTINARLDEARHWVHAPVISADLKIPDATVRGTLRRLAVRGIMRQDQASRAWQLNLPTNVQHVELKPRLSSEDSGVHPTAIECPTCHAWVGWACEGPGYGYHAAGYHPRRVQLAKLHQKVPDEPRNAQTVQLHGDAGAGDTGHAGVQQPADTVPDAPHT